MATPDFPAPVRDQDSATFWDGVESGELRIQVCEACARGVFPPTPGRCPFCRSALAWSAVNQSAVVYSWIGIEHPIHEWEAGLVPYSIVLAQLRTLRDVHLPCLYPGPAAELTHEQAGRVTFVRDYGEGVRLVFQPS